MVAIFRRNFWTHFLNDRISINISLNFIPYGPVDDMSALVQIMAWHTASHCLNQWWPSSLTHICVSWPQWVKQPTRWRTGPIHIHVGSQPHCHSRRLNVLSNFDRTESFAKNRRYLTNNSSPTLCIWTDLMKLLIIQYSLVSQGIMDAELKCSRRCQYEQFVEQTAGLPVIWDVMALGRLHRNG